MRTLWLRGSWASRKSRAAMPPSHCFQAPWAWNIQVRWPNILKVGLIAIFPKEFRDGNSQEVAWMSLQVKFPSRRCLQRFLGRSSLRCPPHIGTKPRWEGIGRHLLFCSAKSDVSGNVWFFHTIYTEVYHIFPVSFNAVIIIKLVKFLPISSVKIFPFVSFFG